MTETEKTDIYAAALSGDAGLVKKLAGNKIDKIYSDGKTLLTAAIANKDYKAVKTLILAGADMEKDDERGYNGWDYIPDDKTRAAVKEGYAAKKLPKDVLNKEFEKFFRDAVKNGSSYFDKLKTLIYAGADPYHVIEPEGVNSVFFALSNELWGSEGSYVGPEFIEGVLAAGIDPNMRSKSGMTGVMYETMIRKNDFMSRLVADRLNVLIKYGADVNLRDDSGMTAMTIEMVGGPRGIILDTLKKAGAKRDIAQEWRLALAMYWNNAREYKRTARFLKADGADVNTRIERDIYPVYTGVKETLEGNGQTALMFMAKRLQFEQIVTLVDELGADVKIKDNDGRTALHYLALSELPDARDNSIMYYLKKGGIDYGAKDKYGKTAFDYALKKQFGVALEIYKESPQSQKHAMAGKFFEESFTDKERDVVLKLAGLLEKYDKASRTPLPANRLQNELWSTVEGPGYAVRGASWFFCENGKFHYNNFYSGGAYYSYNASGTYEYDGTKQEISYKVIGDFDGGYKSFSIGSLPAGGKLKILQMTDESVTLAAAGNSEAAALSVSEAKLNRRKNASTDPYGEAAAITIEGSMNEKPFKFVNVEEKDLGIFYTGLGMMNEKIKEAENEPADTIKAVITVKYKTSGNDTQFTVWPSLNIISGGGSYSLMDVKTAGTAKFLRAVTQYLQTK